METLNEHGGSAITGLQRGSNLRLLWSLAALFALSPDSARGGKDAESAIRELKLPGIEIDIDERYIDVDSTLCLREGALELVACTKGTKEHESIVTVGAKAMHIHTALLLLGAKSGHPAMRKQVGGSDGRWIDLPPTGSMVDISLVFDGEDGKPAERPISDFIVRSGERVDDRDDGEEGIRFPTHTFLFAGSHLQDDGPGPRKYLSDLSGNVISIATFGDETLCLPDVHSHENGALLWEIDSTDLPDVGSKLTLRLRPKPGPEAEPGEPATLPLRK